MDGWWPVGADKWRYFSEKCWSVKAESNDSIAIVDWAGRTKTLFSLDRNADKFSLWPADVFADALARGNPQATLMRRRGIQ
jgi:hypothetical protein